MCAKLGIVAHAFNANTQVAEVGEYLWAQGQCLQNEFQTAKAAIQRNSVTKKQQKNASMCGNLCQLGNFEYQCCYHGPSLDSPCLPSSCYIHQKIQKRHIVYYTRLTLLQTGA